MNGGVGDTRKAGTVERGPASTNVTFTATAFKMKGYMRSRDPGTSWDFTLNNGTKTVAIPFGRTTEIHITGDVGGGYGHILWQNNYRTMKYWRP